MGNNNKVLMALLGGGVTAFLLGYLIYGFALDSFMRNNAGVPAGFMKESPNIIAIILANLVFSLLLTYIFKRWANITTGSGGAAAATIIGFLTIMSFDLMKYATSNTINFTGMITDILAFTVMSAATGAVIGWLLGREETKQLT